MSDVQEIILLREAGCIDKENILWTKHLESDEPSKADSR